MEVLTYELIASHVFSRDWAIRVIRTAVENGIDFHDEMYFGVTPRLFVTVLAVSGENHISEDEETSRWGFLWLGVFWFIDKSIEGMQTAEAKCYIEDRKNQKRMIINVDDILI